MKKNTNKRKFSLVIFIFMILMMILPMNVSAITKAKIELNGNGSTKEPYEITNMDELFKFEKITRGRPGACAKVTSSITINQGGFDDKWKFKLKNRGKRKGWEPIGTKEKPYTGEFIVENGCVINGLYINREDCAGLFGYIGGGAVISGVRLNNSDILGGNYVGGVCGSNNGGTIKFCNINNSKVKGTHGSECTVGVGGVCGSNNGGTIKSCGINNSMVTGPDGFACIGGVCGINNNNAVIWNCGVYDANVEGSDVGGVCGINNNNAVIRNCGVYDTDVEGNVVGGVCGKNNNKAVIKGYTVIRDCTVGDINVNGNYVGGVCGTNEDGGIIVNCKTSAKVEGVENAGGVCGTNGGGLKKSIIYKCEFDAKASVKGKNLTGGVCGTNKVGGLITLCTVDASGINGKYSTRTGVVCGQDATKKVSVADCSVLNLDEEKCKRIKYGDVIEMRKLTKAARRKTPGIEITTPWIYEDYRAKTMSGGACGELSEGGCCSSCCEVVNWDAAECEGTECERNIWDDPCWTYCEDYKALSVGRVESGGNDGIIRNPQIINIADSSDSDVIIVEPTVEQAKMGDRDVIIVEPTVEQAKMGDRDETMTKTIESTGMVNMSAGNEAAIAQYDLNDENPSAENEVAGFAKSGVRRTAGMLEEVSEYESPNKRRHYQWGMDYML